MACRDFFNHTYLLLYSLPDNCSFEQAALAEPLSVILHASKRAELSAGQTVLVFGVGAIGLLVCAFAKSQGASRIVAVDINEARLNFARSNGFASQVFCVPALDNGKTPEDQLRRVQETCQVALAEFGAQDGFDVVFECTGAESCIQMAIHVSTAPPPYIIHSC
jgi:L-iditol 2-dehydrogenase